MRGLGAAVVWLAVGLVRLYRLFVSPLLGPACRFEPSCSRYAEQALRIHGPWRGLRLAARRLVRCQPFCPGGFDPVPPSPSDRESPR